MMMHNESAPVERESARFAKVSFILRLAVIVAFFFMGLKIIRYGYLPAGDVRRDAAQAISGKPFNEVLVMIPEYKMNHNPGWDWFLRQLHVKAGMSEDALVAFSVVLFLFLILCAPLPWLRCPEAWVGALLAFTLAMPGLVVRLTQGRPFLLVEAALIALLLAWHKGEKPSTVKLLLTCAAFTVAIWLHGTWFLWVLLPAAFFLAAEFRAGIWLTICWAAGTILGAVLTGHPFEFLRQTIVIAATVSREQVPQAFQVGELQPSAGVFVALLILAVMFIWRQAKLKPMFSSPLFWMMAMGWILGLRSARFWDDWGLPAALVWLTLQAEEIIIGLWAARPARRLLAGLLLTGSYFMVTTSDVGGRFTDSLRETFVNGGDARLQGWMPDSGGIFYGADMVFFYNTYYKNPQGDWRYIVGFEPAWMPPDDLKIFRNIQWNNFAWDAYKPWVEKMRPQDRLEISSAVPPVLPPLEWTDAGGGIWVGRLPRSRPLGR